MDQTADVHRLPNASDNFGKTSREGRVLVFPQLHSQNSDHLLPNRFMSDAEIAQLVSVALEEALAALGEPSPSTYLQLRAHEAREKIREVLLSAPGAMSGCQHMLNDYRKAMMSQNLTLELALNLVESIKKYAQVYGREIPANIA